MKQIDLANTTVPFKSVPEHYNAEVNVKNNTVREIDWNDERFLLLQLMKIRNCYGMIEMSSTSDVNGITPKFSKRITHVAIWNNLMIVTWEV